MKNPLGKSKSEKFDKGIAKEMAAEAVHKRYPVIPKKMARKMIDKADKKMNKKGIGI